MFVAFLAVMLVTFFVAPALIAVAGVAVAVYFILWGICAIILHFLDPDDDDDDDDDNDREML